MIINNKIALELFGLTDFISYVCIERKTKIVSPIVLRYQTQEELHEGMLDIKRNHPNAEFVARGVSTNDWGGEYWWVKYRRREKNNQDEGRGVSGNTP